MNEIRAFVGHSFTEDDAEVVGKFLKYFEQLSRSHPRFSWEHAEAAEPKVLAEKVMALLSDKNALIAICTKRERVIEDGSLNKMPLRSGFLKAREDAFSWKTSDWIIQEIGLAKGKDLDLILLVERDVRQPGGLQGNVEYIPFDRTSPEKSFGKILEMITALSPKPSSPSVTSPDTSSVPTEGEKGPEAAVDDKWRTPQPEWKRLDYESALWRMVIREDTAGITAIDQAYLETEDAAHGDNRGSWEAYGEWVRLTFGKGGSLEKLKELAVAHPHSCETLEYLARGFARYQDYANAASTFEAAARETTDGSEVLRLMGRAAVAYARAEMPTAASATVSQMKTRVEASGNGELQLLKVLRELAEIAKEDEATVAVMERIVEIDPSDTDTRFSLAYKHADFGNDDLALFHYLRIPYQERSAGAWNNLGVAFDRFSLPAKSVDAYRKAEEMGETLAMSNLAQKFISAGFLPEAKKQCESALAIQDYHKNIGHALARLTELPDEETKKESELLDKAKPKSNFYRLFGRAATRREPNEITGSWAGPDCVLNVRLLGTAFEAVGSYERPANALYAGLGLMGLSGGVATSGGSRPSRLQVKYSGTLRGQAIEAHVTRTPEDASLAVTSLLGSKEDETKVLMVLTDDGNELRVMESPRGSSPRFYTLKRQATNA